jgi:integrase
VKMEFRKSTLLAIVADPKKNTSYWDTAVPSLALVVSRGGAKTFYFVYRSGARNVWLKLGRMGDLTIDEARAKAMDARRQLAQGTDPAQEKRDKRNAITTAEGAARWLDEHAPQLRASTLLGYRRLVASAIVPALGRIPLRNLTPADAAALHHRLRGTPRKANLALIVLSQICKAAETWGDRPLGSNPCQHVRKFPPLARHRYLSMDEIAAVGSALRRLEGTANGTALDCLRLIMLTGARKGEIINLRWDQVDLQQRRALLDPAEHKTGGGTRAKQIPLCDAAVELLAARRKTAGHAKYIFPGRVPGRPVQDLKEAWAAVKAAASRDGIDVTDVRIHDLRHTWGAMATSGGHALQTIGAVMGHRNASTTARYAHVAPSPAATAVEDTGGRIAAALMGDGR